MATHGVNTMGTAIFPWRLAGRKIRRGESLPCPIGGFRRPMATHGIREITKKDARRRPFDVSPEESDRGDGGDDDHAGDHQGDGDFFVHRRPLKS